MKRRKKYSILLALLTILVFTFISIFFVDILTLFDKYQLIKYSYFVDIYNGDVGISKSIFLFWFIILGIDLIFKNTINKISKNSDFYLLCLVLIIISSYTSSLIVHSDRIFYYLIYPYIFLIIPKIPYELNKNNNKKIIYILFILLFIIYWVYMIIINNYNMTLPYVFA
jgi:hypothetical protein